MNILVALIGVIRLLSIARGPTPSFFCVAHKYNKFEWALLAVECYNNH